MSAAPAPAPAPAPASNYGKHLLRGSVWMIAARWAMRLIGLVNTMILARLLAPSDFGLIAMVMLAYGLLETISYAGVDLALMRGGADTREHYDTAWTVQIMQGAFITVLMLASAPAVAAYFNEPRALAVILLVAPRALLDGMQNIGIVAFRKELDFAKEFRYTLYNRLLNFVIVIGAAIWFRNYWALVLGSLASSVIGLGLSYAMHPFRPRLSFARVRDIWSFSQWLMISRVGSYLSRKCDEFVVGGYAGTTAMGNYHVGSDLATLPSNELVMPIRRAMFPSLSKIADKPTEFAAAVLASFSAIAAMCLFVSACLLVVAPEFVAVMLGAKWTEAVPLIRWLAMFGAFSSLVLVLEVPLWVGGKTNLSAVQTWLEFAAMVPLSWFAVHHYGVEGAAAARAGVSLAMVPIMMMLTVRAGSLGLMQLLGALARPLAAAIIMVLVVQAIPFAQLGPALVVLIAKVALCLALYPTSVWALWVGVGRPQGFETTAMAQLGRLVAKWRPA
ncbi:MAG: lipopolysaccharide biosynthesis protein [Proteobacteria bacterium]|nr:lipopolysaccharide biosynthesis protein [Pseudomonadota bacterium]